MDLALAAGPLGGLHTLDDTGLSDLALQVREEQQRRALAAEDPAALVDDAFQSGFELRGMALEPWLTPGGLVVCPGSMIQRSRQAHRCRFVAVGECWVWESPERLVDEIRPVGDGHDSLQTVTVLAGWDGLVLDVITSRARGGVHTREAATAYEVHRGALRAVRSTSAVAGHGRR